MKYNPLSISCASHSCLMESTTPVALCACIAHTIMHARMPCACICSKLQLQFLIYLQLLLFGGSSWRIFSEDHGMPPLRHGTHTHVYACAVSACMHALYTAHVERPAVQISGKTAVLSAQLGTFVCCVNSHSRSSHG